MQGTIAQTLALAIYGNALLRGAWSGNFLDNSTCSFCESIEFVKLSRRGEEPFAASPDEWFRKQRAENLQCFFVQYAPSPNSRGISDRNSVAFVGGGGRWQIATLHGRVAGMWEARWTVGNRNDPQKRVWKVTYGEVGEVSELPINSPDLASVIEQLATLFTDTAAFAREQNLSQFADSFDRGRKCLSSDDPRAFGYHTDLAPRGILPLAAERILGAVQAGWVFGGMGSWNDLGFEGPAQERYEFLSDSLYALMNRAAIEAANTSAFG